MKKITLATVKKFIREGFKSNNLYFKPISCFDGMIDCVRNLDVQTLERAERDTSHMEDNSLGVSGAWFVKSSRDSFNVYEDENFKYISVYNCCGKFELAQRKGA